MIIAFVGRQGQGKTILMLFFAFLFREISKRQIYTNIYGVKSINTSTITSFTQLRSIKDSIIALDETHHDFDSRSSSKNVKRTQWISQIRKTGCIFLYNTQQFHKVDKRLRDETHYVVRCSNLGGGVHQALMLDSSDFLMNNYNFAIVQNFDLKFLYNYYNTRLVIGELSE